MTPFLKVDTILLSDCSWKYVTDCNGFYCQYRTIINNRISSNIEIVVVVVVYRSEDGDRDSKNGDLDMPVDPNEPTYCVCDKVVVCSYYLFVCLFVCLLVFMCRCLTDKWLAVIIQT